LKLDGWVVPDDAIKIHGITNSKAFNAGIPTDRVLDKFMLAVKQADLLVAHNIDFDWKVVAAEFYRQ
jgi:DNA polymerase III epsilon subunit-like protein